MTVLSCSVKFNSPASWQRTHSSHLIVRGNHAYGHPVGISTDTEGVPATVCHRGHIVLIAESEGIQRKEKK